MIAQRRLVIGGTLGAAALMGVLASGVVTPDPTGDLLATARVEDFEIHITEHGVLRPAEALTYHSPLVGRETEVTWLAPEGVTVQAGDLLVCLDGSELTAELQRYEQQRHQAFVQLQIAEADAAEADADLTTVRDGEGAMAIDEGRAAAALADRKAARARDELATLQPLLERGYVTRDEVERAALAETEAAENARLARQKADVLEKSTRPKALQRASLTLARRRAQVEAARVTVKDLDARIASARDTLGNARVYARGPGLIIYEENLSTQPRRKVRVGDRVSPSQGLVTVATVQRMQFETSAREADMHRLRTGQDVRVSLEAYPGRQLNGRVAAVGTVARPLPERPHEGKRFDVSIAVDNAAGLTLRPEMTGRARIVVSARRRALVIPVNAVFLDAGRSVVRVQRGRAIELRHVTLGDSDTRVVEVVDGLRDGERVRLTE